MSRKKVDLRLKKKSDSSVREDATSSGVNISTENSDFKRVGLLSEKTRYERELSTETYIVHVYYKLYCSLYYISLLAFLTGFCCTDFW